MTGGVLYFHAIFDSCRLPYKSIIISFLFVIHWYTSCCRMTFPMILWYFLGHKSRFTWSWWYIQGRIELSVTTHTQGRRFAASSCRRASFHTWHWCVPRVELDDASRSPSPCFTKSGPNLPVAGTDAARCTCRCRALHRCIQRAFDREKYHNIIEIS